MKFIGEIRDPVHGYIHITDVERETIDTSIFQRLRRIRQLAGANLTYPGAQHTRFEHSLGTMYLAGLAGSSLSSKTHITEDDIQELRLSALLHDVGHGPFSHLFEEALTEKKDITHEDISQRIIRETEIKDVIEKHGFDSKDISELALGLSPKIPRFMNEIIAGGLSVDIMDYLLRDSYFTGVEYGRVDVHRLINSFEIVDERLAIDQAALYAFEAFTIARYEMFKAVYFHKTVRAAQAMLIRSIILADDGLNFTDVGDLKNYLRLTDESTLAKLIDLEPKSRELNQAKQLAIGYRDRRLIKCVFEKIVHRKDRFIERILNQKSIRDKISIGIADEAGVDPDMIFFDVPTTPSVPYTSSRQSLSYITLVHKTSEGISYETVPIKDLALVGAIMGYMDIIRIYTQAEHRSKAEKAVEAFFGREGYSTKVSM
ncbi:MAG: HD domain-containing protein [Candidatus Methylarchaceae archaeon HK01B]|nr:HD domain-containing protein [Candidatus Methylarchaceae archaeon HK01B]